jgi:hypothetical protein
MRMDRPATNGLFWALTVLMTDNTVELSPREVHRLSPLTGLRAPGAGVVVSGKADSAAVLRASAAIAEQRLRPIVRIPVPLLRNEHGRDRMLSRATDAGIRDLLLVETGSNNLECALDDMVALLDTTVFKGRNFDSVGVTGALQREVPVDSAELLRPFGAASDAAARLDVRLYLMPAGWNVTSCIAWERSLRAAGNRLPVRIVLDGRVRSSRSPSGSLGMGSLEVAMALDADHACLVEGVHLRPMRSAKAACQWANAVAGGCFVIESDVKAGRKVTLIGKRAWSVR